MSSDSYAPCPGGTGKKVKFCCPELVGELPKIDRMIEAEQRSACLDYIEGLEKKYPGRVCLLANKALVLGNMGRIDEANNVANEILTSQPQNPVALGEKALLDATSLGVLAALPVLQQAIENSSPSMPPVVYGALNTFAQLLVAAGHLLPARAHALLATGLAREDENALRLMLSIENSQATSLFMKQDPTFDDAPADVPWRERYEAAGKLAARGAWRKSIEQLEELARRSPAAVPIWRNLSLLRGWLADYRGSAEAARHLATLEVSDDEAIEAEAFAQVLLALSGEPTIAQQLYRVPVNDVERVATTLTAAPHADQLPLSAVQMPDADMPPPRLAFVLLDRPKPSTGVGISRTDVPMVLAHVLLFGKETDREARLEVQVFQDVADAALAALRGLLGDAMGQPEQPEVLEERSAVQHVLSWNWRLPEDTPADQVRTLVDEERRAALLERWTATPLPALDGKMPRDVAQNSAYRRRLQANVLRLELTTGLNTLPIFQELRKQLNLPEPHSIELGDATLSSVPLVRWHRLVTSKLNDSQLVELYRRARLSGAEMALRNASEEATHREALGKALPKSEALYSLYNLSDDSDEGLSLLHQCREALVGEGKSCARIDLEEVTLRLERQEPEEAVRVLSHLQTNHVREPGVAQALMNMLTQLGLVRPDGSLAAAPPAADEGSSLVIPGQGAGEPGKLWTPDSAAPAGKKSALWTPGMQ